MSRRVLVLSGPNLGRLGSREPEVYGAGTYVELAHAVGQWAQQLGLDAEARQTNSESELIEWLYEALDAGTPVVLNPAAFTHYSYALRDAVAQVTKGGVKVIEVHLSNPSSRETFRHHSVISAVVTGTIAGFGWDSYRLALASLTAGA